MDSFTLNKIAGAVLGTCLIGMGIGIVGDAIYSPEQPKKPGFALPTGGKKGGGAKKPTEVPLSVLLSKADPKKGEADAKVCGACHNFEEGAGVKVGPDLYGVVDREKGSVKGFDYSAGMKKKGGKWTYEDLFQFIKKPSAYVQGTKMSFGGEESPEKRAEIIAYLHTLSKKPVPLPKVSEADKKAAEGGGEQASGGQESGENKLIELIGAADPKKGEADAKICSACHNFKKGEGTKVGPDLYGVVDREKGSVKGFDYSAGMKKKGGKWTYEDLNQFLTKPSAYVQGTKMGFGGEPDEKKRATIIAYLRSNADKPEPLPKASPKKESAKSEGKDAGGGGDAFAKQVASADPKKGENAAKICGACHNFKKGEGAKVGPDLYGVVDREKGSAKGFDYSAGMKKKGGKWTYDDLNQFLTKPSAYVQGTKMGFGGEPDEKKRAAIVAYLRSNADKPAPLPGAGGGDEAAANAKAGDKKADDKKAAEPEKKTEVAPSKPDDKAGNKKAEDKKAAEPEKKTEAAPSKPDDKAGDEKAEDKKAAEPEKKSDAAPPKPENKAEAKPDDKTEAKTDGASGKNAEASPAPAAGSGSTGVKMEEADLGPPQPYAAPNPQVPQSAATPVKEAPAAGASSAADEATEDKANAGPPEPYSAPTPQPSQSASAEEGTSASAADAEANAGPPEPYSAPTPQPSQSASAEEGSSASAADTEANAGPPEPYSAPTPQPSQSASTEESTSTSSGEKDANVGATEQKSADASAGSISAPFDQTPGSEPEPYSAPTPEEAAAAAR